MTEPKYVIENREDLAAGSWIFVRCFQPMKVKATVIAAAKLELLPSSTPFYCAIFQCLTTSSLRMAEFHLLSLIRHNLFSPFTATNTRVHAVIIPEKARRPQANATVRIVSRCSPAMKILRAMMLETLPE